MSTLAQCNVFSFKRGEHKIVKEVISLKQWLCVKYCQIFFFSFYVCLVGNLRSL